MDLTKLKSCELFLFDMDGTLYLGDNVYPGAHELMEALPSLGKRYIYLTNNSSRAGTDYITRLRRLGFPCEAENVFTSGMATGLYLNQNYPGARVYLAGTKDKSEQGFKTLWILIVKFLVSLVRGFVFHPLQAQFSLT